MEHRALLTGGGYYNRSEFYSVRTGGGGGERTSFRFIATHFVQHSDKSLAVVREVMKLRVS